jgi:hypothetical protein
MDEQQFDSLFQQPFGGQHVIQADAGLRRCIALGIKPWGRTSDDRLRHVHRRTISRISRNAQSPDKSHGSSLADTVWHQRSTSSLSCSILPPIGGRIFCRFAKRLPPCPKKAILYTAMESVSPAR